LNPRGCAPMNPSAGRVVTIDKQTRWRLRGAMVE
jgi:hypothetical protein